MPWERMAEAVATLDGHAFQTADDVHTVLACLPTEDERAMLGSFLRDHSSTDSLTPAELFCLDLMQVPFPTSTAGQKSILPRMCNSS